MTEATETKHDGVTYTTIGDQTYLTVGDMAKRIGCNRPFPPNRISKLIYDQRIDTTRCLRIGGRWLIPETMLPEIIGKLFPDMAPQE